jgi:hypothetical protein
LKENGAGRTADSSIAALVLQELERVLESPGFRNSHQSQRLLRHLVERSLEGRFDELRERVLGVELFGRPAGFDTNDDPIVRVRANEVRKRLARYYESITDQVPVRLDMPTGAYRVEFRVQEPAAEVQPAPAPPVAEGTRSSPNRVFRLDWRRTLALAGVAAVAVLVGWVWYPRTQIEQFWGPVLQTQGRVIVCTGHPVVYRLSKDFNPPPNTDFLQRQTAVRRFQPGETIDSKHIIPIEDQYTGLGSAHAMARVAAWLATQGKSADIRFGDDISFTDLKQSPAVLIGFANRWTVNFTSQFRFVPELIGGKHGVRDRQTGKTWILPNLEENGRTDEDYVLVSRTFYSDSGQCLITAAGLTQYGTQAGGEIISDPGLLAKALQNAPAEWQKRNLQMLFHVRVVGHAPGPPALLALHEW